MADMFLVADIGGTNTRVGLADDTGLLPETTLRFRNRENANFRTVLETYLADHAEATIIGACAGAAGPVKDGVAKLTNLDWQIDRQTLQDVTGAKIVDVINDLPAQGLALDDLAEGTTQLLKAGEAKPRGARLVLGLGTGVNLVPVHQVGDMLLAPSAEAGHETLPYRKEQAALCDWLRAERQYPSVEVALAGQGIENLYEFHAKTTRAAADVVAGYHTGDAACVAAMTDYVALLGAVIGDHALVHMPEGGIFLTGGVARSVAPIMKNLHFADVMCDKGRFSDLAGSFSVNLITDDFAALKGCARHLRQLARG
ncbi:glucokinase [Cognatishimia maritima]|uniref:Glucokinase n=1 Tax=Cognatishimia maritima TaxID=870908 RepID=A0A1M5MZ61_9RHOB|nr:glucokinase [Cognatishimia maritima]SHG82636.1 glucokinase [Cognatishimia maritima]